jgi:hypothetical protein
MMSHQCCIQNAETCEARSAEDPDAVDAMDWLEMAAQWRALAKDGNSQATTARLMNIGRAAH